MRTWMTWNSHILPVRVEIGTSTTFGNCLKNLFEINVCLLCSRIPLLDLNPAAMCIYVYQKTCTKMLIALFQLEMVAPN